MIPVEQAGNRCELCRQILMDHELTELDIGQSRLVYVCWICKAEFELISDKINEEFEEK